MKHKVNLDHLASVCDKGISFADWMNTLPDVLGAKTLKDVAEIILTRPKNKHTVFAYGGHVIKTGCAPIIIDLMHKGLITAVATHGAGAIHDIELAMSGSTSEDVENNLEEGCFGNNRSTMEIMNRAFQAGAYSGLGHAIGAQLIQAPNRDSSILYQAYRLGISATIHVAIGTDTIHMFHELDGAAMGRASLWDFRQLVDTVKDLSVWINVGSAVIMPEVFLKAVASVKLSGGSLDDIRTVNMDMYRHYRPTENVIKRPVRDGNGYEILGQHEIILPLLRQMIIEKM